MKKLRILLFLLACILAGGLLRAQDLIYRINPVQTIECRIIEVGETHVRYSRQDTREDVLFVIPTEYITRIVFGDGKEIVYNEVPDVSQDRRNALKLSFLSPTYDATTLFYERGIKAGQSMEFGLGVIGLGLAKPHENAGGIILKAGYKFMSRPEHYQKKYRYAHLMKGSYFKPEITYVNYKYDSDTYHQLCDTDGSCEAWYRTDRAKVSLLNFGIVGGKQWVFQNSLLLDLFTGIGLAVGSNEHDAVWNYNFIGGTDDVAVTFTLGFKIGFLF